MWLALFGHILLSLPSLGLSLLHLLSWWLGGGGLVVVVVVAAVVIEVWCCHVMQLFVIVSGPFSWALQPVCRGGLEI